MKKTDTRKLKPEVQEQLRRQVVRLRKSGKTYKEISEIVGIHLTNVCKIFKADEEKGQSAIKAKKRGRKTGSCRTLDQEQESRLKKAITDKTPDQLKFPFALWTRKAVQQLIQQLFSIDMPIRTVGEYLNRWGFTPHSQIAKDWVEQNKEKIELFFLPSYSP
jgi:transposase